MKLHRAVLNHADNNCGAWFTVGLDADGTDTCLI